jgi:single-strand DNA-binding protein
MPSGLNRVMLLGDLAGDPEVHVTRSGQVVLTLRLGTTESYRDHEGVARERVGYHRVVLVGKRADALSKVLHRGARVFVEGSLRTTATDGRDGKKRTQTEVVAAEVLFAGAVTPSPAPAEAARFPVNESFPFR